MVLRAHVQFTPFDASSGAALTSATVNVFQPGTVTPVVGTLFDKNGNTLANPLTSDATTGLVDFYMNVAQEVDLQVAKSGFTTRTYSNVPVLDDAGNDLTALLTNTGDLPYASAANTPARLAAGATGALLDVAAGVPNWLAIGTAFQMLGVSAGIPAWIGGFSVIGSTTLGADTANITFSGISSSYKHLVLFVQARGDGATVTDIGALQFNGDTAANYDRQQLSGANAAASAAANAADTKIGAGVFPGASVARASIAGASLILIPSYAATTFEKTVLSIGGYADSTVANSFIRAEMGSWRNTAAISSIKFSLVTSTNLKLGSTATLIGLTI